MLLERLSDLNGHIDDFHRDSDVLRGSDTPAGGSRLIGLSVSIELTRLVGRRPAATELSEENEALVGRGVTRSRSSTSNGENPSSPGLRDGRGSTTPGKMGGGGGILESSPNDSDR